MKPIVPYASKTNRRLSRIAVFRCRGRSELSARCAVLVSPSGGNLRSMKPIRPYAFYGGRHGFRSTGRLNSIVRNPQTGFYTNVGRDLAKTLAIAKHVFLEVPLPKRVFTEERVIILSRISHGFPRITIKKGGKPQLPSLSLQTTCSQLDYEPPRGAIAAGHRPPAGAGAAPVGSWRTTPEPSTQKLR